MGYLRAVIGYVLNFFGWLLVSFTAAAAAKFALMFFILGIARFFPALKKITLLSTPISIIFLLAALLFSGWRAHQTFFIKAADLKRGPRLTGAYFLSVALSVGSLFLIGFFLIYSFMASMSLSCYKPKIGFFQPIGYAGPRIPKNARNIYISQVNWLDSFLFLRFEASPDQLEAFARSSGSPVQEGVRLPTKLLQTGYLHGVSGSSRWTPFTEVRSVAKGRSFLDETHRKYLLIDDENNRLYYFLW